MSQAWTPKTGVARAQFAFEADGNYQLSLAVGDELQLSKESGEWLKGTNAAGQEGIFPSAYVTIDGAEGRSDEALLQEITMVLREWRGKMMTHLKKQEFAEYQKVENEVSTLCEWRRVFSNAQVSAKQRDETKHDILKLIEAGRRLEEGYIVPRTDEGEMATVENSGVVKLHQLHRHMQRRMMEGTIPTNAPDQYMAEVASGRREGAITSRKAVGRVQMKVDMKAAIYSAGEPTRMYVSLWSPEKGFLTEEFLVAYTNAGMPEDLALLGKVMTVFRDVTREEIAAGLYLVTRIYRFGALSASDIGKKGKGDGDYTRPYGCAVAGLTENNVQWLTSGTEVLLEDNAPIFSPVSGKEALFPVLHEYIVRGERSEYEVCPRSNGVAFGVSIFEGELREASEHPQHGAALRGITVTNKVRLSEAIDPGESRNDMYITLRGGEFSQDRKASAKNVEVQVHCIMDTGSEVSCLRRGTGSQNRASTTYRSAVYYHTNAPLFQEVVHLEIPEETGRLERSHILLTFHHVSATKSKNYPFSFAFLPLTNEHGVVLDDGEHTVQCYKLLNGMDKGLVQPTYLTPDGAARLQPRSFRSGMSTEPEVFKLRTELCSTRKTQNEDLHDLLNWKNLDKVRLGAVLQRCMDSLVDVEIVKFLREIFDAITAVFSAIREDTVINKAFSLFCYILNILTGRFSNFRPMMEQYIADLFTGGSVHIVLIRCVKNQMVWLSDPDEVKLDPGSVRRHTLNNAMTTFPFIIKFIIAARNQEVAKGGSLISEQEYQDALRELVYYVDGLMAMAEPVWVKGTKGKCLKNFARVFQELAPVFPVTELGELVCGFLQSVPLSDRGNSSMNSDKLMLLKALVCGPVFEDVASRELVMPSVIRLLQTHLERSPMERRLSVAVVTQLVRVVQALGGDDDVWGLSVLLPDLLKVLLQLHYEGAEVNHVPPTEDEGDKSDPSREVDELSDCAVALLAIVRLMTPDHLDAYLEAVVAPGDVANQKQFISDLLRVCRALQSVDLFADVWLQLWIFMYQAQLKVLGWVQTVLCQAPFLSGMHDDVREEEEEGSSVWGLFFDCAFHLLTAPAVALESPSCGATKREFIVNQYGDMRVKLCQVVSDLWSALGEAQLLLVRQLVAPLLEMANRPCTVAADMCLAMYFDLLKREYAQTKRFLQVEERTIDSVDRIVSRATIARMKRGGGGGGGDAAVGGADAGAADEDDAEAFISLFTTHLDAKFRDDPQLSEPDALTFITEIKQLFELLGAMARYPMTAEYEDERTYACLKLMTYLQKTHRDDMYIKYAQSLCALHNRLENYSEAANALLLHAECLAWGDQELDMLDAGEGRMPYPPGTESERKEALYREAIDLLDRAQNWEAAVRLCAVLQNRYQTATFRFDQLSQVLKDTAAFYDKITSTDRFYASYFRVGFFGGGYSEEYRNKEYVFRGQPLESIIDFSSRIRMKFPNAATMPPKANPDDEMRNGPDQHMQISSLTPAPAPGAINSLMTNRVKAYLLSNDVDTFFYQRPFRKRTEKSANEFLDLWVEKMFLTVKRAMPGTQRRALVTERRVELLNPLQNAVTMVADKNKELKEKIGEVEKIADGTAEQGFTMALNGVVDAAVNGGVANYQVFITGEYRTTNPEIAEDVDNNVEKANLASELRTVLADQLSILQWGVEVHGRKCSTAMRPLHDHMNNTFQKMKTDMNALLALGGGQ